MSRPCKLFAPGANFTIGLGTQQESNYPRNCFAINHNTLSNVVNILLHYKMTKAKLPLLFGSCGERKMTWLPRFFQAKIPFDPFPYISSVSFNNFCLIVWDFSLIWKSLVICWLAICSLMVSEKASDVIDWFLREGNFFRWTLAYYQDTDHFGWKLLLSNINAFVHVKILDLINVQLSKTPGVDLSLV